LSDSAFQQRLAAACAGDETAFTELFRSVQPQLLRYLRTVGGSLADDVAAETWLSVVKGLDRFRGDESGTARGRSATRGAVPTPGRHR
jgi:RNA polymerase sigma-70 factor (ECF subfamily)